MVPPSDCLSTLSVLDPATYLYLYPHFHPLLRPGAYGDVAEQEEGRAVIGGVSETEHSTVFMSIWSFFSQQRHL